MSARGLCLWCVVTALILAPTGLVFADGPAEDDVDASVAAALAWLAGHQQPHRGFPGPHWSAHWNSCDRVASTGIFVTKTILGTGEFDVTKIDPASVTLAGVAPLRWDFEDVATPFEKSIGRDSIYDCSEWAPDSFLDISFTFNAPDLAAALSDVRTGDALVLPLKGKLLEEFGGAPIEGEDVVLIVTRMPKPTTLTLGTGLSYAALSSSPITIDVGPVYVPPGAGTESYSDPFTPARSAGATVTQAGYDLTQTANLWFGIRADSTKNGYSMDGPRSLRRRDLQVLGDHVQQHRVPRRDRARDDVSVRYLPDRDEDDLGLHRIRCHGPGRHDDRAE